ncbi:MAG: MBL fold metallo-hydrolase, partial [bacterium]|nr:MBL fold metallo-hydrolase [bacterium]
MRPVLCLLAVVLVSSLVGCGQQDVSPPSDPDADAFGHTPPTEATGAALALRMKGLPLADPADREEATRGLVAQADELQIPGAGDNLVWNRPAYDFIQGPVPDSVNPSLWRQAELNNLHGLFEVTPGIHQVRGYDLANMSLIEGERGLIVVDPLGSAETGAAALAFARKQLGDKPVTAVILTHSHVDHFGGTLGVTSAEEIESGSVRIIAPAGFLHEATSENLLAGPAMARRASFMYGFRLARSPRGHIDSGLGKEPGRGSTTILPPTDIIDRTPQEMTLDGVRFVFQYAPESEAPAELMFYLPEKKAFCGAEVVSRTMHNLYT